MFFGTDRVAGCDILQSNASANVARVDLADLFTFVGVHLEQASDTLGAAPGSVEDAVAGLEMSGVDANKRKLTDKRIGHNLEGQRGERLIVVSLALQNLLWIVWIGTLGGRNIKRRGEEINDWIEPGRHGPCLEVRF